MHRIARMLTVVVLVGLGPIVAGGTATRIEAKTAAPKITLKALFYDTRNPAYRSPFGAVPAGTPVTFKLRTAHKNVKSATLQLTQVDPGSQAKLGTFTAKMSVTRGKKYDTWATTFTPASIGVFKYDFKVVNGKATAYYTSSPAQQGGPGVGQKGKPDVSFRMTVYTPGFTAPSWVDNAVMYQIFPDRFYNGDPSNDSTLEPVPYGGITIHSNWSDAPIGGFDFFGGDLKGIDDKISYLKDLGITVLYLNPIFLAPSNHKYDTSDYMTIDPHFGKQADFDRLVADAKAAGMRIILDGVFNHSGSDSIYFDRYHQFPSTGAAESQSSPYFSWYKFLQWPDSYDSFFGYDTLPNLQEVDPVKDFIFRKPDSVAQTWLSRGTAGWRLDAAQLKSHTWWQQFRTSVKAAYPDSIMICECDASPIDATPWLLGNEVDGAMNYRFRDAVLGFFARGNGTSLPIPSTVKGFSNALMSILEDYPKPAVMSSMNLVDSHDTERILTDLLGNKEALREVATLQMTWLGIPHVYYGDETGLTGGKDPDDRRTFPWDGRDTALEGYYAKVIAVRHANTALQNGSVTPEVLDSAHRVFGFVRQNSTQTVGVVINDDTSARSESLAMPGVANGASFKDALGGASYTVSGGKISVRVPAHTSVILVPA